MDAAAPRSPTAGCSGWRLGSMRSGVRPTLTVDGCVAACCASASGAGSASKRQPRSMDSTGPAHTPSSSRSTGANAQPRCRSQSTRPRDSIRSTTSSSTDSASMSATRTVFDLALARAHPHRIEAAIDSAVRLQLSSPEVLARRLAGLRGSGRWGCRLVEEMIADSGGHTHLERRFLELVREAGLPRPRTAGRVQGRRAGTSLVSTSCSTASTWWSRSRGRRAMPVRAERARDAQRRNELQDLGMRVYEYTFDDVTKRSEMVRRTLGARLHHRRAR